MKIVRTIVWVLLLVVLLIFSINNWNPVEVKIWDGIILETKIPALAVIAFLIGLVPMWLLHRATLWNNQRRIASLETAARTAAITPLAPAHAPAPPADPAPDAPPANAAPGDDTPRDAPPRDETPRDGPLPARPQPDGRPPKLEP